MGCSPFTITVSGEMADAIENVRSIITRSGGSFTGDETAGQFSSATPVGRISGAYSVRNDRVEITITNKPLLVTCNLIESKIREYFR